MQSLNNNSTLKPAQSIKAGGVFIVGFAGPNPGQFGYREETEFAAAYNAYHGYLARGWDAAMSYLESPKDHSAIPIFSEKAQR